jgi:hypothetical protein
MESSYWETGNKVGLVVGAITFIVSWIYCVASYGYLLGVGLGWLPSLIVAVIAYFASMLLWGPLALLLSLIFIAAIIHLN